MRRQTKFFDRFKSYLNKTIELFRPASSPGLRWRRRSWAELPRQKSLSSPGTKINSFSIQSFLEPLTKLEVFLDAKNIGGAKEKLADLDKSLKRRQKITKLADKSEACWLEVKEYQAEELAGDSEDEKRIREAQERALKNKKQNAPKRSV